MKRKKLTYILLVASMLSGPVAAQVSDAQSFAGDRLKSRGVPAYPHFIPVSQPDGKQINIAGRGDGVLNWFVTADGYTLLKDKGGNYVYAVQDEDGNLLPSSHLYVEDLEAPTGLKKGLLYSPGQLAKYEKQYYISADVKANPLPFPSSGNNNVLVVLAEFPDRQAVTPRETLEQLMNAPGYNGTGSLRDYYLDISYGVLDLNATVNDWVQVSQNMSYYGANDEFGYDIAPGELVREALDQLESQGFDFSPFDNDNDGYVDEIVVFHAGYGEQFTGAGDTCIWSHAFSLGDLSVTYDGVILDNYIIGPELYGFEGDEVTPIGTMVHEFAHSLAIPDLYDVDGEGSGGYAWDLNFWDLMAVGSWNNEGTTPAGINVWLKEYMGWMTIPEIGGNGSYSLQNAYEHQEGFRINSTTADEYFILENRQYYGSDIGIPGYGMLVYHVDLNHPGWETGYVNIDPSYQGFDLLEADNIRDSLTIDGDSYPGWDTITSLSGTTTPGLVTWIGDTLPFFIENIRQTDSIIYFDFSNTTFEDTPLEWEPDTSLFSYSDTIIARVKVDAIPVEEGILSAFSGEEPRGRTAISYYADSSWYVFPITIYSNSEQGEILGFKYYSAANDSVYALMDSVVFSTPDPGSYSSPLNFNAPVRFQKNFIPGWNWFSINIASDDMSPGNILSASNTMGDYIKSQTQSSTNYGAYGWFGTLNQLSNQDLYLVRLAEECDIDVMGAPVDPASQPIDLVAGWNWVSYVPQQALSASQALSSLNPSNLDYVKNQTQSTTFYNGYGWFGTLEYFYPGQGYMMDVEQPGVLTYPTTPGALKSLLMADSVNTSLFNPHDFEYNGTVTIALTQDHEFIGAPGDQLIAYVGEECRGYVEGLYFDPGEKVVFPIMVYSHLPEGDLLTFRYYSSETDQYYEVDGQVAFVHDMIEGDAMQPEVFAVTNIVANMDDEFLPWDRLQIYPNPFKDKLTVEYAMEVEGPVMLELLDISGRLIYRVDEGYRSAGIHRRTLEFPGLPVGTYLLRISSENFSTVKTLNHH